MSLPKGECYACGRLIAVRSDRQSIGPDRAAGKHRAPHLCPHGVPCIAGTATGGQGHNVAPTLGPNGCRPCHWKGRLRAGEVPEPGGTKLHRDCMAVSSGTFLTCLDQAGLGGLAHEADWACGQWLAWTRDRLAEAELLPDDTWQTAFDAWAEAVKAATVEWQEEMKERVT